MYDTGSPISLICPSVYLRFFEQSQIKTLTSKTKFVAANGEPLLIRDSVSAEMSLEDLDNFSDNINLFVLKNQCRSSDLILERDFLIIMRFLFWINPARTKQRNALSYFRF